MGIFKLTFWNHNTEVCSKRVEFDIKDHANIYARGLYEGLTMSNVEVTGYTLLESGDYVAVSITKELETGDYVAVSITKDGVWVVLCTPNTEEIAEALAITHSNIANETCAWKPEW
jgi:roadblock/LC7 domain-containing protein